MMLCDDNPEYPEAAATNRTWARSLIRNVCLFILRLLKRVSDQEDIPPDKASLLSRKAFYRCLAKTMVSFRRKESDQSHAIIWVTNPTRRYGTQFRGNTWVANPALLAIDPESTP